MNKRVLIITDAISSLEIELESTRAKHSQDIQQMKAEFLRVHL